MPSPPSLMGRYQLAVLGPEGDSWVLESGQRLKAALGAALEKLGVDHKRFLNLIPSGSAIGYDPKLPCVAVYFGRVVSPTISAADMSRIANLLSDGILMIPVVSDTGTFTRLVPPEIAHLNGICVADCGAEFERLAARLLEGLGLLRESRRLFISYRRVETSGVAAQLYEALDQSGFDVFLDTHGVLRPGDPFQEVLWHRMADTDVAVVLDSPGFMESRWTEEELARTNTATIQILQILWPGQGELAPAAFSTFYPLSASDFASATVLGPEAHLVPDTVNQIVDSLEGLRARAIGARHAFLVREFVTEARNAGLKVRRTLDHAILIAQDPKDAIFVLPAVGVPDAVRYQGLERLYSAETSRGNKYAVPSILLYDQAGIQTKWLEHLKWLDGSITRVRSLSLADARDWLAGLPASPTGGRTAV